MKEFFRSKQFLGGVGVLVVLMALTNPGQLWLYDNMRETLKNMGMPSSETYTNLVILSYGRSLGYKDQYIQDSNGKMKFVLRTTDISYIGMFNNYFSIVELENKKKKSFEIIPN